ncbi:hypothetical protein ACFYZJ_18710 [Streptomyces sp. NPDC001848]
MKALAVRLGGFGGFLLTGPGVHPGPNGTAAHHVLRGVHKLLREGA